MASDAVERHEQRMARVDEAIQRAYEAFELSALPRLDERLWPELRQAALASLSPSDLLAQALTREEIWWLLHPPKKESEFAARLRGRDKLSQAPALHEEETHARLTDSCGYCYRCGERPALHDYAPTTGGVLGYCTSCLPTDAVLQDDGVHEEER